MRFFKSDSGYVLVVGLLFLPVFLLIALLVIDISRGNNAHSDLQAAADATALAGAVELDGGTDAITRAETAMGEVWNTVSLLEPGGANAVIELEFPDNFTVIFLDDIPASDDTVIDQAWADAHATTDGTAAAFVYVRAEAVPFQSIFASAAATLTGEVPISASAVATSRASACDMTPLFICNPFETTLGSGTDALQTAFAQGKLHGRIISLHPKGNTTAAPGNFGFLQIDSTSSASAIRDVFAGDYTPECYEAGEVTTKPGAATSISTGINVRFDVWNAPYKNTQDDFAPSFNVRKQYSYTGQVCNKQEYDPDTTKFLGFPNNGTNADGAAGSTLPPGTTAPAVPGAAIGFEAWPIIDYWNMNHAENDPDHPDYVDPTISSEVEALYAKIAVHAFDDGVGGTTTAAASPGAPMPSRYDVYRYEIEQEIAGLEDLVTGDSSPGGETGEAACYASKVGTPWDPSMSGAPIGTKDRRLIHAAIIDCLANPFNGSATVPVNSYASVFMVRPMEKASNNGKGASEEDPLLAEGGTIDVEIIDITGNGGNGTLDAFVRREAYLVR